MYYYYIWLYVYSAWQVNCCKYKCMKVKINGCKKYVHVESWKGFAYKTKTDNIISLHWKDKSEDHEERKQQNKQKKKVARIDMGAKSQQNQD